MRSPSPRARLAQTLGTEKAWRQELSQMGAEGRLVERFFQFFALQKPKLVHARERTFEVLSFLQFQQRRGIHWRELKSETVDAFLDEVQQQGWKQDTLRSRQRSINSWARFLFRHHEIEELPDTEPRRLARAVETRQPLTYEQIRILMSLPRLELPLGLRDRALLEVAYSTGMRPLELEWMDLSDLDVEQGVVLVRKPKNRQERLVPLSRAALHFLARYLQEARPALQSLYSAGAVWLNYRGQRCRISRWTLTRLQGAYNVREVLGRNIGLYHLRHSLAKHLLAGGADLREVQQWLGHECLRSTQHYIQQDTRELRELLLRCHPLEQLELPSPAECQRTPM